MAHSAFWHSLGIVLLCATAACSEQAQAPSPASDAPAAPQDQAPAPAEAPAPPAAAEDKPSCNALDMAMLRDALGAPALELDRADGSDSVLQCRYVAEGGDSVLIQIQRGMKREFFDSARELSFPDLAKDVKGLGDTAYSVTAGNQHTLVTLAGDRSIQLTGSFNAKRIRALAEKLIEAKPF